MYRTESIVRTGPAPRERPCTDPDFGGSNETNRHEETTADFLKWDTTQPGAKLAAMSNKSKSQPQQQQQHQQQPHQQHVIKLVEQLPPRYQPPPQPTSGILKNHLHFPNGISTPSSDQAGNNQGPSVALSHHQSTQPRSTLPPPLTSSQQQQQTQLQQQQQQQQPQQKDAQGKYSPRIEHLHHPQSTNPLFVQVATSKSQQQPSQAYLQSKLSQGPYLPPSSQYPAVNSGQTVPGVRQRISDEEFVRLGPVEMLKFVRKTESDIARLAAEQNRQIQSLVSV